MILSICCALSGVVGARRLRAFCVDARRLCILRALCISAPRLCALCALCALCVGSLIATVGCATDRFIDYYLVLGPPDSPEVAAVALINDVEDPLHRTRYLLDIADIYIRDDTSHNAALLLESALFDIRDARQYDDSAALYPASNAITRHDDRASGDPAVAALYIALAERLDALDESELLTIALTDALVEIRIAPPSEAQRDALQKLVSLCITIGAQAEDILNASIETILVYQPATYRVALLGDTIIHQYADAPTQEAIPLIRHFEVAYIAVRETSPAHAFLAELHMNRLRAAIPAELLTTAPRPIPRLDPAQMPAQDLLLNIIRHIPATNSRLVDSVLDTYRLTSSQRAALIVEHITSTTSRAAQQRWINALPPALDLVADQTVKAILARRALPAAFTHGQRRAEEVELIAIRTNRIDRLTALTRIGALYLEYGQRETSEQYFRRIGASILTEPNYHLLTNYFRLAIPHIGRTGTLRIIQQNPTADTRVAALIALATADTPPPANEAAIIRSLLNI